MSDARLIKLLSAKIEELEAELATARMENVAIYGTSHPEIYKTAEDEVKELRAELAASQEKFGAIAVDFGRARAELAAEREHKKSVVASWAETMKERDALRAGLVTAGEALEPFAAQKPVSWSLDADMYYLRTDDIHSARAALTEIRKLLEGKP